MQAIVKTVSPTVYMSGKNMQKIITPPQDNIDSAVSTAGKLKSSRHREYTINRISLTKTTIHASDSENSITNNIFVWEKYAENHNTTTRQYTAQ